MFARTRGEKSEDARPLLLSKDADNLVLVATFDGLGGAGSSIYESVQEGDQEGSGPKKSGAWHASRAARQVVRAWFHKLPCSEFNVADVASLEERLGNKFDYLLGGTKVKPVSSSRLRSNLFRSFPTTMAIAVFCKRTKTVTSLSAGDSRCYVLGPSGLQQISKDDIRGEGDALTNLRQDAPLSNFVHADGQFEIDVRTVAVEDPTAIISATDGCFQYWPTPLHFEWFLLRSLFNAKSEAEWRKFFEAKCNKFAGDDYTLSLSALGWESFESFKASFRKRLKALVPTIRHLDRLREVCRSPAATDDGRADYNSEVDKAWTEYRGFYEMYISPSQNPKDDASCSHQA